MRVRSQLLACCCWVVFHAFVVNAVQLSALVNGTHSVEKQLSQPHVPQSVQKATESSRAWFEDGDWSSGITNVLHMFRASSSRLGVSQAATLEADKSAVGFRITWEQLVALYGLMTTALMVVAILATIAAVYWFDYVFGRAVQEVLETVDRALIGVDVTFGQVRLNPCSGWIRLMDVKVSNPVTGHQYKKDYLLKARRVLIDVDMLKLIFSLGHVVHLEAIELIGVEVLVEKALSSSNVQDVLHGLSAKHAEEKKASSSTVGSASTGKAKQPPALPKTTSTSAVASQASKTPPAPKREVILGRIELRDIRVRLELDDFKGIGADLDVADIEYADFSKEVGNYFVDEAFVIILKTILKSVVRTVFHNTTACCSGIIPGCGNKQAASPAAKSRASSCSKLKALTDNCTRPAEASCASCCVGFRDKAGGSGKKSEP
eukprot:CAMPEP_0178414508 /NCGR_PEP_ID=MMETSP0689_2-20121128/23071_1 /TAXON_ID=160604 /ORGANISM="Amphidinium massartii, Strain CS-259" /LENGTH=432 /DNA_ID=CAMNT_0020035797 /DNA_START=69 /DNA_END=1363 /DNA_ORIENTATION=+